MGRGGLEGLDTPPRAGGDLTLISQSVGETERLGHWAELWYHKRRKKEEAM